MSTPVIYLEPDRLLALSHPYEVDGRVSWHDPAVRGFAPMNSYLLLEDDTALLCDTGLSIHESALLAQLHEVLGDRELEILLLRQGEFDSMCNLAPIVTEFGVSKITGQYADAPEWADFRPQHALDPHDLESRAATVVPSSRDRVPVGASPRALEIFVPALRLLGTYWAYDAASRTLFTSDAFSWVTRSSALEPWVVTEDDDDTTPDQVEAHLLGTRYWWLPGAFVDDIRTELADIFERHDVERIAPGFGCILDGRPVVDRHVEMLDDVIRRVGRTADAPLLNG